MTRVTPLRVVGALLLIAGLVLAVMPTLVSDPGPAVDTFAAIERRIWWGGLAGVGLLFLARTTLKPWSVSFAHLVMWVVLGFLIARVIGLALDGMDSAKQWMWTAIEAVVVAVPAVYLWRRSARATDPPTAP